MKNKWLIIVFILITTLGFAQKDYQKGYYVESDGVRTEGYLEIIDFSGVNSSEKLYFRKEINGQTITIKTDKIVEFGLGEDLKFQKFTFEMDDVSFYKDFTSDKELTVKSVNYFLNVLVDGEASLYSYEEDNGPKYFYGFKSKPNVVQQLVYKKYISGEMVKENNTFKEQLFKEVKCDEQTFNEFVTLKYDKKELIPIFEKYNKCKGNNSKVYKNKFEKNTDINVVGIIAVNRFNSESIGYGFGGEFEVVLPSEKFAFFARLSFESMDAKFTKTYYTANNSNFNEEIYDANYKSFDLFFGARYYFKINNQNKVFVSAAGGVNQPDVSGKLTKRTTNGSGVYGSTHEIEYTEISFFPSLGAGYLYKNKYAVALEFDIQKTIFRDVGEFYTVRYTKIGLNFRYIFN